MESAICPVASAHRGVMVTDGAGVRINRIIGTRSLDHVDPFVLLDEIRSDDPDDYVLGFPTHPHRGIETITYMIHGAFRHRDSRGGGGLLTAGCTQWMTAGGGILHSEMPESPDGVWGYQLWLSLPRRHKMVPPRYQHIAPADMKVSESGGVRVQIISGRYGGLEGPASNWVRTDYFDVRLGAGATFSHNLPAGMEGFFYVHSGTVSVCGEEVPERVLARLGPGDRVELKAIAEAGLLFVAGVPNREPIARGGPFVMNTWAEIEKAFEDYRNGTLF